MNFNSSPIGSLARALREAQAEIRAVERQVDAFLESLFPGWRRRFPTGRGWRFLPPDTIDIYRVVPSPAAVDALRRAGFLVVTLHEHDAQIACACRPEPPEPPWHPS